VSNFKFTSPQESLGLQFWKLHQAWQKKVKKALSAYKITHTQFVILATIQWHQEKNINPTQAELSKLTGIDKMTLSKAVVKLEAMRLVIKILSSQDTRAVNLTLAKKAMTVLPKLIKEIEQIDSEIFAIKDETKKRNFQDMLVSLNKNL